MDHRVNLNFIYFFIEVALSLSLLQQFLQLPIFKILQCYVFLKLARILFGTGQVKEKCIEENK